MIGWQGKGLWGKDKKLNKKYIVMGMVISYLRVTKKEIEVLTTITDLKSRNLIFNQAKEVVDIDKSWEVLHFLLTKEKYPTKHIGSKIIYPDLFTIESSFTEEQSDTIYEAGSPEEIDAFVMEMELDTNYLSPEQVVSIFDFLKLIKIKELITSCDFDKLNDSCYALKKLVLSNLSSLKAALLAAR